MTEKYKSYETLGKQMSDLIAVTRKKRMEMEKDLKQMEEQNEYLRAQVHDMEHILSTDILLLDPSSMNTIRDNFSLKLQENLTICFMNKKEAIKVKSCSDFLFTTRVKHVLSELIRTE